MNFRQILVIIVYTIIFQKLISARHAGEKWSGENEVVTPVLIEVPKSDEPILQDNQANAEVTTSPSVHKFDIPCAVTIKHTYYENYDDFVDDFIYHANQIAIPLMLLILLVITLHMYFLEKIIRALMKAAPNSKRYLQLAVANLFTAILMTITVLIQMLLCLKLFSY